MAAWTHIAHDSLSLPAASVTWSSIPTDGTYDHLLVKVSARTDKAGIYDPVRIQFNGDSTSGNYSNTYIQAGEVAASVSGGQDDGENYIHHFYAACGGTALADTFGAAEIWIPNYANSSTYKSVICSGTVENNLNGDWEWVLTQLAGLWQNQNAITQIDLTTEGLSKYQAYSTFDLYGIKGA